MLYVYIYIFTCHIYRLYSLHICIYIYMSYIYICHIICYIYDMCICIHIFLIYIDDRCYVFLLVPFYVLSNRGFESMMVIYGRLISPPSTSGEVHYLENLHWQNKLGISFPLNVQRGYPKMFALYGKIPL